MLRARHTRSLPSVAPALVAGAWLGLAFTACQGPDEFFRASEIGAAGQDGSGFTGAAGSIVSGTAGSIVSGTAGSIVSGTAGNLAGASTGSGGTAGSAGTGGGSTGAGGAAGRGGATGAGGSAGRGGTSGTRGARGGVGPAGRPAPAVVAEAGARPAPRGTGGPAAGAALAGIPVRSGASSTARAPDRLKLARRAGRRLLGGAVEQHGRQVVRRGRPRRRLELVRGHAVDGGGGGRCDRAEPEAQLDGRVRRVRRRPRQLRLLRRREGLQLHPVHGVGDGGQPHGLHLAGAASDPGSAPEHGDEPDGRNVQFDDDDVRALPGGHPRRRDRDRHHLHRPVHGIQQSLDLRDRDAEPDRRAAVAGRLGNSGGACTVELRIDSIRFVTQ